MRIGFVGCGAIGSCYASYLSRKHEVCVLDTYAPVIESIKKNGILLDECAPGSGTGETVSFRPAMATTDPKEIGVVDLLIVFVHYQYLEAAVRNARVFRDIQREFGSFSAYLWGWTGGRTIREFGPTSSPLSDAISADLKKRGMTFVGTTILYAYLQAVGVINAHSPSCSRGSTP